MVTTILLAIALAQTWNVEDGRPVLRGEDGTAYIFLGAETTPDDPPPPPPPPSEVLVVPTDYTTIQSAIFAAQSWNVIAILAGTYPERLTFPEVTNLTILGEGLVEFYGMDTQGADGLTVENVSITAPADVAGEAAKYAIFVRSDDVTLYNIYVHDVPGTAIFFKQSDNPQRGRVLDSHLYRIGKGIVLYGRGHLVENVEIERLVRDPDVALDADYLRAFGYDHIVRGVYAHGTILSEVFPSHVDGFQTFGADGRVLVNFLMENSWFDTYHQGALFSSDFDAGTIEATFLNCVFAGAFTADTGLSVTTKEQSSVMLINCFAGQANKGFFARDESQLHVENCIVLNSRGYWPEPGSNALITGGYNLVNPLSSPADQQFATDLINVDPLVILTPPTSMPFTMSEVFSLAPGSPALFAGSDAGSLGPR